MEIKLTLWNYRIVMKKYGEDVSYDVCEVYYQKGKPVSYALNKNVLSHDSLNDLFWSYEEIEKAFHKPVLEDVDGELRETALLSQGKRKRRSKKEAPVKQGAQGD